MKYDIKHGVLFKRGLKKFKNDKKTLKEVEIIIEKLSNGEILEPRYNDHKLQGEYKNCRECHIKPDLLLIYQKYDDVLLLLCIAVGSHSELF